MTTADQDYIINLEIALGRPLTPANAGTEDQQKKKKVLNDSRFDQRISYDNLVILCQKFHLSPEEIATAHRNEREKNSSISCDAGTHLQKMLIERIADTGSEYEKKFSAFVRDVATLNEDLEKKHINHQRFNHTYPKQPLFFFED